MHNRKRQFLFIFLALTTYNSMSEPLPGWIDGIKMKEIITNVVENSLGASRFQKDIESKVFSMAHLDGEALLGMYAARIGVYLNNTFKAVERLRFVVEEDYNNEKYKRGISKNDARQCCLTQESQLVYSNEFMTRIGTREMCTRISKDAAQNSLLPMSQQLLNVMKSNRNEEKTIKWQYYGTEEGIFVKYPRQKDSKCDVYDPRYRPWYAETTTSHPKDIVIVFDRSGSVGRKGLLPIIKSATSALLQTLNAADRVGLVAFNSDANSPPGERGRTCYYNELAFAISDNLDYLSRWLDTIDGQGVSNYKPALEKAFSYFSKSADVISDPRSRRRVIVFLSDGEQDWTAGDDGGILQLISLRNAELNNTVSITTYGIGAEMSEISQEIMRNMSLQTLADLSKEEITPGEFIRIKSSDDIRSTVGTYYKTLNDFTNGKPVITTPYMDFSGLGLIVSVCLPVNPEHELLGVICIDTSLNDIVSDVINLPKNINSYAFISDYKSITILHPLMPDARVYDRVIQMNINDLENDSEAKEILKCMQRGHSGKKTFVKNFVKPRGNTTTDGVQTLRLSATYHWRQIEATPFAIAVVTTDSDLTIHLEHFASSSKRFIYHRLDLVDNVAKCTSHGRLSTKEHSVVKLTAAAFTKNIYYSEPETKENINIYTVYMEDSIQYEHDRLKLITKQMAAISEELEVIWMEQSELDDVVVWRYYGDYYGHIRIYPGITLPKEYDHTERSFFWKTTSDKDVITLTPPYLDAFGAGVVTTLSKPILLHSAAVAYGANIQLILGVIAMDIKTSFIRKLIEEAFPACLDPDHTCFVMDSSGYLIYHSQDNLCVDDNKKEVYSYHITEREAAISVYLIREKYLVSNDCVDFGYKKKLLTWRMELDTPINSYHRSPYFDLVEVPGTNVYLGIKKKGLKVECDCPDRSEPGFGREMYECKTRPGQCSCPCFEEAHYDHCKNQFPLGIYGPPACIPQPHSIGFKSPITNEEEIIKSLPECFSYNCSARLTETKCGMAPRCSWCQDIGLCVMDSCPHSANKQEQLIIISATVLTVVGILTVVLVVVLCVRKQQKLSCCQEGRLPKPGAYIPETSDSEPTRAGSNVTETDQKHIPFRRPDVIRRENPSFSSTPSGDIRTVRP